MNLIVIILIFIIGLPLKAETTNLCDILDIDNCTGVTRQGRRSSMLSLPSPTTSASSNPATVSFDRGLGIESIHQEGNPLLFSISSGNRKIGGALISTSLENSFFGNRVFELNDNFLNRSMAKDQYKTKKISLPIGAKLFRKKSFSLDAGILLKRHSEIKIINPGAGVSSRVGFLNIGASIYQDDYYLGLQGHHDPITGQDYTQIYNDDLFWDRFTVQTYSIGTNYKNLAIDAGFIRGIYRDSSLNTKIYLYSGSFIYKEFMFNMAYRYEYTPTAQYLNKELVNRKSKSFIYAGAQASLGKHLVLGLNYNYFLLEEYSISGTIFF